MELGSEKWIIYAAFSSLSLSPYIQHQSHLRIQQHPSEMLTLTLTADLTGFVFHRYLVSILTKTSVSDLRPDDSPENPFWYTFKVQCTSCREVHPNFVNVSRFVSILNGLHRKFH
jgi:hypothetical protein